MGEQRREGKIQKYKVRRNSYHVTLKTLYLCVCYLQEQWIDADDPWLWNGREEVVFYSEGENIKRGSCFSSGVMSTLTCS